jgi:hypothetical protein
MSDHQRRRVLLDVSPKVQSGRHISIYKYLGGKRPSPSQQAQ